MPNNRPQSNVALFEHARPRLLGIAYRILGSRAEAEDAVQDTFIRWQETDLGTIKVHEAWLTTTCTRLAIDMLRASHRSRVNYVGNWLPEPVHTLIGNEGDERLELAASLSTAFLLMLERLTPKERAAYLLYEIFEMSYTDVAATLAVNEPACRKLVSRAKTRIGDDRLRYQPPRDKQEALLKAFEYAIRTGRPGHLAAMLVQDVRLTADGGGKVPAVTAVLEGSSVLEFLTIQLNGWWASYEWESGTLNGARGLILRQGGQVVAAVSFAFDRSDYITDIFIVRNPDKLRDLGQISIR